MSVYISLLRGINVSGQKKVNMKELKALYELLNFKHVTTYIQSGNVVFSCVEQTVDQLKVTIEAAIKKHFELDVPVLILSKQALENALLQLPFNNISIKEQGSQVIFSFLSHDVSRNKIETLDSHLAPLETLAAGNNVVYLHCPNGYGKTKISNNFLEKKLNVTATSRNLKTIVKLCELSKSI